MPLSWTISSQCSYSQRKDQQPLTVGAAGDLVTHQPHQRAAPVIGSTGNRGLHRQLLVVEQHAAAAVQGAQGRDLGGIDAQLIAEMAPQRWWHYPERVEYAAAHAQEPDVQR
jgi:hypothetical protein